MNLPNKLTMVRVALIPVFVVLLLGRSVFGSWSVYVALIVFCAASFTDFLDGMIARKYDLVTNFGKFMDPLADKLLVVSALVCLIEMDRISAWVVLIIIAREFIISGFRLVAVEAGIVIAASYWGKLKTTVQMTMIIFILVGFGGTAAAIMENILIYLSVILTIVSLVDYMYKNRHVITNGGNI